MINVIDKEKVVQYKGNQKYGREQVAVLTLTMDGLIWKVKFEKSLKNVLVDILDSPRLFKA